MFLEDILRLDRDNQDGSDRQPGNHAGKGRGRENEISHRGVPYVTSKSEGARALHLRFPPEVNTYIVIGIVGDCSSP